MKAIRWIAGALTVLMAVVYCANGIMEKLSGRDQGPVIEYSEELLEVSVHAGDEELLQGMRAQDRQDGDLTGEIIVGGVSGLIGADRAKVTYLVFDTDDNMALCQRQIRYTDYRRPRIRVAQPLVFADPEDAQLLEHVTVTDLLDGDLSGQTRVATLWKTSRKDVYAATVVASNSRGDTASVKLPVRIRENGDALTSIRLRSQVVYLPVGGSFDPMNYLMSDSPAVTVRSEVMADISGCYWVWYENSADQEDFAILTVVVE